MKIKDNPTNNNLVKHAKNLIAELSPKNVFLFGTHDPGFKRRFEKSYNEIRREYMIKANRILEDLGDTLSEKEYRKIKRYRERLEDETFYSCDRVMKQHNNGEVHEKGETNVRHRNVDLIHFYYDINVDSMHLFGLGDMLNRSGADNVRVFLPLTPYQREDKKDEGKVPIYAKLYFDMIKSSFKDNLERIVTVDLHADQEQGFSDGPVENLSAINLFARYTLSDRFVDVIKETGNYGEEEEKKSISDLVTIVAPDVGGAKRAKKMAELLGCNYFIIDKSRSGHGESEVDDSVGYIDTPYAIVLDDLISTGGTTSGAADEILKKYKNVKQVIAYATHGEFCPKRDKEDYNKILSTAEDTLRNSKVKVVVTDTIPRSDDYYERNKDWLVDVISMARPLANIALTNRIGFSVSQLLGDLDNEVKRYAKSGEKMNIRKYMVKKAA